MNEVASLLLPCIKKGEFLLSNGSSSTWYADCRELTYGPNGWKVAQAVYDILMNERIIYDTIGGVGYGGAATAVLAAWKSGKPSFVVRTDPKDHGMGGWIVGPLRKGDKVVLLEDTITTGRSVEKACGAINMAGGEVMRVICLLARNGLMNVRQIPGIKYTSLVTPADLGLS